VASIIILGPSQWKDAHAGSTPIVTRQRIRDRLNARGHTAFLMEDFPGADAPLQSKFEDLLRSKNVTDVLVYWPKGAKTITLQQELVILFGKFPLLRVWIFYQTGTLLLNEHGWSVGDADKGRYTNDLLTTAMAITAWTDVANLDQHIDQLAADLHGLSRE